MGKQKLLTRKERKALSGWWYHMRLVGEVPNEDGNSAPYESVTQGVLDRVKNNPFMRRMYFTTYSQHKVYRCLESCCHDHCNKWEDNSLDSSSLIQPKYGVLEREDLDDGGIRLKSVYGDDFRVLLYPPSVTPPWPPAGTQVPQQPAQPAGPVQEAPQEPAQQDVADSPAQPAGEEPDSTPA